MVSLRFGAALPLHQQESGCTPAASAPTGRSTDTGLRAPTSPPSSRRRSSGRADFTCRKGRKTPHRGFVRGHQLRWQPTNGKSHSTPSSLLLPHCLNSGAVLQQRPRPAPRLTCRNSHVGTLLLASARPSLHGTLVKPTPSLVPFASF